MYKIFIDGQVGTTGLQIVDRLKRHSQVELLEIPYEQRKSQEAKAAYLNTADVVVLCLPDAAAIESVKLIKNQDVKILDASTAHRISDDWIYGLPELSIRQRDHIRTAKKVSVPGCYATGFNLAMRPLVESGIVPADYPISVNAVSGYSGGGKKLIEKYRERENATDVENLWSYRPYALKLKHKHLPEMQKHSGLKNLPLFVPSVGHYYQGMLVQIPLSMELLANGTTLQTITDKYNSRYDKETFINVYPPNCENGLEDGFLSPKKCNGTNNLDLFVYGHEKHAVVIARLDNLGKGASGAAVQNLNIMLGLSETEGLE